MTSARQRDGHHDRGKTINISLDMCLKIKKWTTFTQTKVETETEKKEFWTKISTLRLIEAKRWIERRRDRQMSKYNMDGSKTFSSLFTHTLSHSQSLSYTHTHTHTNTHTNTQALFVFLSHTHTQSLYIFSSISIYLPTIHKSTLSLSFSFTFTFYLFSTLQSIINKSLKCCLLSLS